MFSIINKNEKGFTLIEMLVSVALFSVVLTVTLGSILTIADANKKARSLMSVMSNLNFAVDSITRSIKTGTNTSVYNAFHCVETRQVDYNGDSGASDGREEVAYCFDEARGVITRAIGGEDPVDLTAPDVDIDYLTFNAFGTATGDQPRVLIKMEGTVQVSPRVSSNFSIQTTVSQRQLNL